jgi:hypothetical protein
MRKSGVAILFLFVIATSSCSVPIDEDVRQKVATALDRLETLSGEIERRCEIATDASSTNVSDAVAQFIQLEQIAQSLEEAANALPTSNPIAPMATQQMRASLISNAASARRLARAQQQSARTITSQCIDIQGETQKLKRILNSEIQLTAYDKVTSPLIALLQSLVSWPGVFLLMFVTIAMSSRVRRAIASLMPGVRSFKVLGVGEVELNSETAGIIGNNIEEAFSLYRARVNSESRRLVKAKRLNATLAFVVDEIKSLVELGDLRCTVHVQDVVFEDSLYQLLDYQPRGPGAKGGAGRCWTIRFGLIGFVWRTHKSMVLNEVSWNDRDKLITEWGMTEDEVGQWAINRKSLLAFPLTDGHGIRVGVFYMDHDKCNAFAAEELIVKIEGKCNEVKLGDAVANVVEELGKIGPDIKVYG